MPTSGVYSLHYICERVLNLQPESIADLGSGFGKYGLLMREYTDVWQDRYQKCDWSTRIDAVEGFEPYVTGNCIYGVYSNVFIMDVLEFMRTIVSYDVFLCIDVLEHFEKQAGRELLDLIRKKTKRESFIGLPMKVGNQRAVHGNELETHRSEWKKSELEEYGMVTGFRNAYLLHIFNK